MTIDDEATPVPSSSASGALATDPTLAGPADISVNAADAGSGLYRTLILVDGVVVVAKAVDANGGRCADVNPGNQDPYEFALAVPCKRVASATAELDTRSVADGSHNLKVQLEDAGGNRTTVVNRSVRVANGPVSVPALSGSANALSGQTSSAQSGPLTLSFQLSKRRLKNGQVLRYSGRLTGTNTARKFVDVQVRNGRRWQVVCSVQTGPNGFYACRHRFTRTKKRTRYVFRARVRQQAELSSRTITTKSRGAVVRP